MFRLMATSLTTTMIPSESGHLEARFDADSAATRAIVLCHPHPQFGGSMDDAVIGVVDAVARRHGFATLRFNFRGVGQSSGRFGNGAGEVDDLLAAVAWLRDRIGAVPIWLAGYSFGSNIVWKSIDAAGELAGVLLVAPPVTRMDFSNRPNSAAAIALIAGDADDFVSAADLRRWAAREAPGASLALIAGADHFFSGSYAELKLATEQALA